MSSTLDIKLQGREYRVACPPEELEGLSAAAALLDTKMGEVAKATKSTGERLAVMTALNLAYELNLARRTPVASAPEAVPPSENSIDAEAARSRIKAIEARLDAVLSRQDALF